MPPYTLLFTDIEADGPIPAAHSMLSFASVARGEDGSELGEFEANLLPLPNAAQHPDTMAWWATQPEAWAACHENPRDPAIVIPQYAAWIESLPGAPVLVAHPISFDSMWILWYLYKFAGRRVFPGPGLDIPTYAHATFGWEFFECHRSHWPADWLGGFTHTHKAIDDARGYAHAFFAMRRWNAQLDRSRLKVRPAAPPSSA